ncbi:MAG TPA: hypothetical protein DCQ06_14595, partial [Myxococcales bacterium]|nr:hypothetical protein [Myxococcales bacterium]
RMFDAFATQGKKDGTGLGLAMVRRFTDAHGGSVWYEDTPGGGATFVLDIALHTLAPSESLQGITDTSGSDGHKASKN